MKFSIITVTKNSEDTITSCVNSILDQSYGNYEIIIKDGGSTDNTINLIPSDKRIKIIESSDTGIYCAMNQAFNYACGDIVFYLNSDDVFHDKNVLKTINNVFNKNNADVVYGNIKIVDKGDKVIRNWISKETLFGYFCQIPHPGLFVRRSLLLKLNQPFDPSLMIAADFKQQLILFYKFKCKFHKSNIYTTKMLFGGKSTGSLKNIYLGWVESYRSVNDVVPDKSSMLMMLTKIFSKFEQILRARLN